MDQWSEMMANPIAIAVLWHGVLTALPFMIIGVVGAVGWWLRRRRISKVVSGPSDLQAILDLVRNLEGANFCKSHGTEGTKFCKSHSTLVTDVEAMVEIHGDGLMFLSLTGLTEHGPVGRHGRGKSVSEMVHSLSSWDDVRS